MTERSMPGRGAPSMVETCARGSKRPLSVERMEITSTLPVALLFTGVHVHSYAHLEGAVVLPYAHVGRNARLTNVVIDRGVKIPEGLVVGEDPKRDVDRFRRTDRGICLITQAMIDRLQ